ncbi:MAG TPA: hypothetical protein ENI95_00085 [Chloroflexi bacterium]|nr:hypothetical protein [Chloroflexota bacterium]
MPVRRTSYRLLIVAALALLAGAIACNLPGFRPQYAEEPPTPYVIFVTATPEGYVPPTPTPTPLVVGPFRPTLIPPTVEPTLDLGMLTLPPTLVPASPTPTGSPAPPTATPTITPTPVLPTATPTALPPTPTPLPVAGPLFSDRLGVNFISSAQHQASEERFRAGLDTGAGWDRFAIYWNEIEAEADQYEWGLYDDAVRNDVLYGLRTDAILLGMPQIYSQSSVPAGLYEPVFADGSDVPDSGKAINPDNPWAEFVYAAVERYRPGGALARTEGWGDGQGVRVWEIWNEPDFTTFWGGSVQDYARLLEVAYIAAKQADPGAQIMMGGLVLFEQPGFLIELLNIFRDDPAPVGNGFPFDIVALHSYSHPPYTFYAVQRTESLLAIYGLGDVPIWLNESGVAVWDDYPGPEWATRPDQIVWRATQEEQASYVIQNAAYAFMAGADVVFHFQLYDDCGNQPRGTTFAPHDGSLCDTGAVCWGDALGLMRNAADNVCFNQHPQPNTPRPAYEAFHLVGEVFAGEELIPLSMFNTGPGNRQRWLVFARPQSAELILVIWNEGGTPSEAVVFARSEEATLITQDGERTVLQPEEDGTYRVTLPPATNRNQGPDTSVEYMISGPPVIVIQQTRDPFVSVLPLLDRSRPAFLVKWRSSDPSLNEFQVWYRDETGGGDWQLWIETDSPGDALFVGGEGRTYSFFARARLPDGEWTEETPVPQATTTIE